MNTIVEIKCNICQSSDSEILYFEGSDGIPLNVSSCKKFGLTFLNPRGTKEAYSNYYANEYDGNYRLEVLKPELDSSKHTTSKQIVKRLTKRNALPKSPINILDIGSGMGWSSVYLKDQIFKSANFFAIEPSLHCIENLKKYGIDLLTTDIDDNWDFIKKKNKKNI